MDSQDDEILDSKHRINYIDPSTEYTRTQDKADSPGGQRHPNIWNEASTVKRRDD